MLIVLINMIINILANFHQIFIMQLMTSRSALIAALHNTINGDLKAQHEANIFIQNASLHAGFVNALMDILNDSSIEVGLKQTTLIRFKNYIKLSWQSKKCKMSNWEKEDIKRAIIPAILQCDRRLIRAFKEVLTLIAGFEYKSWLPIVQIIILINKEDNLVPLFHILIAIAKAFEFSITEEERHHFFEFIKASLPTVLNLVNKLQDQELTYLGIKLLWKAVHYDISAEVKDLACEWMPLLQMVVSSTNSQFDRHPEQVQQRYSPEFYYFHSKKWANRIFLRFIQKHAKAIGYGRNDNRIFSDLWYTNYGQQYISALLGMLSINTAKKVRYFQLKSLRALIEEHPEYMEQYAQAFQYDILIRFIRMRPQDQQLASNQPMEFFQRERELPINFFNTKLAAIDAWIAFSELGMQNKKQIYDPGVFFYQNISYLQSKLQSRDPVQKELAMCLLCQMHSHIIKSSQTTKILPLLINKYIVSQLRNPIMLLRARALDVFSDYGLKDLEEESMKEVFEAVYTCLTKDQHPLVRINAAFAFNSIIKHKTAKHFVGPLIKDILTAYLQLLQNYDMDIIIDALQNIAQRFTAEISPFVLDLVQSLGKIFFKSVTKDVQQSKAHEYNGQAELLAAECLKAITSIIQSSILPEIVLLMKQTVLGIIEYNFGQASSMYMLDCVFLLNTYLYKSKEMSGQLWFYFQAIVYFIVGIPLHMRSDIDQLPLPQNKRNILKHAYIGQRISVDDSVYTLRNYIQKISLMKDEPQFEAIKNNLISLLLHLFTGVYKKGSSMYTGVVEITCCTVLMIYMLENFQSFLPDAFYNIIWDYIRRNLSFNSQSLNVINSQLLGLLLWAAPTQIIILARSQNMLAFILKQITVYWPRYEQNYQRSRVVLGINSLLLFANKSAEIQAEAPQLFKTVLNLIEKNASKRLQEEKQVNVDDDISQNSEDYWDERYNENYDSALKIDEIAEFRMTIEQLRAENSIFYELLVQSVSAKELTAVDDKIYRVLQKAENTDHAS